MRRGMVGVQPLTDATVLNQTRACARLLEHQTTKRGESFEPSGRLHQASVGIVSISITSQSLASDFWIPPSARFRRRVVSFVVPDRIVEEGKRRGEIRADVVSSQVAILIVSTFEGRLMVVP